MQSLRQKNSSAETALRCELHARGLRYRIQVPVLTKGRRVADGAFSGLRIAIFVDGCPSHPTRLKQNAEFWHTKILANQEQDRDSDGRLRAGGGEVLRVWANEPPKQVAERIAMLVEVCKERGRA